MVTKTTVVCWIVGITAIIGFLTSMMNMPAILAGQYMIVSVMILLGAMYFNIKYKKIDQREKIS